MAGARKPKAPPKAAPAAEAIDPTSAVPVLEWVGGRRPRYVPAHDLDGADLARIAYRRASVAARKSFTRIVRPGEPARVPTRPDQATSAEVTSLAEELLELGSFRRYPSTPEA